jgi:hypothetical protein
VVDRPAHQRHEPLGGNAEPDGRPLQRYEVVRGEHGAGVVERPVLVRELERPQPERLCELARDLERLAGLAADRRPDTVELRRVAAAVERLQRVEREPPLVRLQRGQRRGAGDMSHRGTSRCQAPRHVGDGRVRNAEEDDVRIVLAHGDAALAQAGCDSRADAARADDMDSLDHGFAPAP